MRGVYKMIVDCGRMGNLTGVFAADSDDVKNIIGKTIYFGEVLGKHSEIVVVLDGSEMLLVTEDANFVQLFEEYKIASGFNPFNYLGDEEEA